MSDSQSAICYVVGTPIGNLFDVSSRVLCTLESVHTVFAEDTRNTGQFLAHFSISTRLVSLQQFNERSRVSGALDILRSGESIAIVSDAGTPCISDPGALLIKEVISAGFKVSPIPGASAVTSLMSVSGLGGDRFYFGGFFPRQEAERKRCLEMVSKMGCPSVFFESPNRLISMVTSVLTDYPTGYLVLGKEITKQFETFFYGSPADILDQLSKIPVKGEWCVVVSLPPPQQLPLATIVTQLKDEGLTKSQIKRIATHILGYPRNDVYQCIEHYDDLVT